MANKNNQEVKGLLDAGVHFGHLTRKWNPNMAPYIYMERNGIHIINLYKTAAKLEEANEALKKIAASGRKILFVATKKQAKDIVAEKAGKANMPYITERWPGGMLTNFITIRKAVKKMAAIDRSKQDGTFNSLSKKERLAVDRTRAKLDKNLGSIVESSFGGQNGKINVAVLGEDGATSQNLTGNLVSSPMRHTHNVAMKNNMLRQLSVERLALENG